jgi:hypothetical protein
MSLELSEFQPTTIKQASNRRIHKPKICIVDHDHFAVITWFGTHIIVRGPKSSNFGINTFKLKIQLFVLAKNLTKQLVLIAKCILKLDNSRRKTLGGSTTKIESKNNLYPHSYFTEHMLAAFRKIIAGVQFELENLDLFNPTDKE